MEIRYEDILLRDYRQSDIEDEIRWMNEETAWMVADMPWETVEPVDPEKLREEMTAMLSGMPQDAIRWRLEIEKDGTHIGFVSSYYLGEDYRPISWETLSEDTPEIRALGIEICEPAYWGRGIGTKTLSAFMDDYRDHGETRFALETWSGNVRMLGCAEKLGFREAKRERDAHQVGGQGYDALVLERNQIRHTDTASQCKGA